MTRTRSSLGPLLAALPLLVCTAAACDGAGLGDEAGADTTATVDEALATGRAGADGGRVRLAIEGVTPITGSFKSVSGMDSETEVVDLRDGTTADGNALLDWSRGADQRRSGTITVLDQDMSTIVASYRFAGARLMTLIGAVPGSAGSPQAIEKIEIAVEKVERVLR